MGVATGCGCKEVYYLSLLLLYLFFFTAASLLFVHLKNVCLSCITYSLINMLLLCKSILIKGLIQSLHQCVDCLNSYMLPDLEIFT